jgi:hypothetical protein
MGRSFKDLKPGEKIVPVPPPDPYLAGTREDLTPQARGVMLGADSAWPYEIGTMEIAEEEPFHLLDEIEAGHELEYEDSNVTYSFWQFHEEQREKNGYIN